MIWSIPREREDFSLFWNNRDDPSRANFLFHGLNQANELRPAQGYCGREADILGTTASLGLDGVIRLEHLHDARSPCEQNNNSNRMLTNHLQHLPCRLAYGREKIRTVSCGDHQKMSSLNILAEHRGTFS
jgi:hypothetical protein